MHQQRNPNPALNPNPNPTFYKVKLENYGINITPDKNRSRNVKKTSQIGLVWKLGNTLYAG